MGAALADMAPDKMALVRSDMRQRFPPPREPDVSEIDAGQKCNAESLFLTQKYLPEEGRALCPLARVDTTARARGPVDPPTRPERPIRPTEMVRHPASEPRAPLPDRDRVRRPPSSGTIFANNKGQQPKKHGVSTPN